MINGQIVEGKNRLLKPKINKRELLNFDVQEKVENPDISNIKSDIEKLNEKICTIADDFEKYQQTTPRIDIDLTEIYEVLNEFRTQINSMNENIKNLKNGVKVPQIKIQKQK
jgi:septal ring factor EnvC (AmiA/AmiB activator)